MADAQTSIDTLAGKLQRSETKVRFLQKKLKGLEEQVGTLAAL
jgi:hypothetical protein|eukprot:COSAG01_NODE_1743_length_9354_cov_76.987574_4_plen_43_part_00